MTKSTLLEKYSPLVNMGMEKSELGQNMLGSHEREIVSQLMMVVNSNLSDMLHEAQNGIQRSNHQHRLVELKKIMSDLMIHERLQYIK